jgi:uncharacterized protein involved in oxidation of intracellular sulfur
MTIIGSNPANPICPEESLMKAALIVSNPDPEIIWNAFRLANLMLNEDDDVSIFLHGSAVEFRRHDSQQFPLNLLAKTFALSEGVLLA